MKKTAALLIGLMTLSVSLAGEPGNLKKEFYTGDIRLSKSMFDSSAFGRDELRAMYKQGEWEKLVNTVLSKRAAWDTYYFYLGRAAEELGYQQAAIIYYELAINSDHYKKCDSLSMFNMCDGFKFPDAAQARIDHLTVAKEKFWEVKDAPLLRELIGLKPESIDAIASRPDPQNLAKRKFETDEEYAARKALAEGRYFLAAPLDTGERGKCISEYDHASGHYVIRQCRIFSDVSPALSLTAAGETFSLANAFDKRDIQRIIYRDFRVVSTLTWAGKYKISRDEAVKLDSDLMVGIVFSKKISSAECAICDSRKLEDANRGSADLVARLDNKPSTFSSDGWRNDAFKDGTLEERWEYIVVPKSISKIFVYRNSDMRVLYAKDIDFSKQ